MVVIKKSFPYILIVSIFLANIIIYLGLIKLFFGSDDDLVTGILSLVGAVLGGALTLVGVKWTLEHQVKRERQIKKEQYRTYLSASTVLLNFDEADKVGRSTKHRIFVTESLKRLLGLSNEVRYYSIIRHGGYEVVKDCHFKITIGKDNSFKELDTINVWVDFFEKDEELLIPLCSMKFRTLNPSVKEIEATFYTPDNDKVEFIQSEINNTRKQTFYDGNSNAVLNLKTEYTAWTQKSI